MALPDSLRKGASPDAPLAMRLMLARGQLPLGFSDRLGVLAVLEEDPDPEVRRAASDSWASTDLVLLAKWLRDSSIEAPMLNLLAARFAEEKTLSTALVVHPNAGAAVLVRFVSSTDPELLERIAANQRVLVENPEVARALLANPLLETSVGARLRSLIGVEEEAEAPGEAGLEYWEDSSETDTAEGEALAGGAQFPPDLEIPEEFSTEIPEELLVDQEEEVDFHKESLGDSTNIYKIIQTLSIAEKIKLATLGSKSARKLLSRDSNRLVITAVIRSPKIREDEVVPLAQDRTTPDDVLVYIMTRKEWMKNYQIRLALCKNPKTPLPKALRIIESLGYKDLRGLAKNRNIPAAVASAALRLVARKAHH